MKILHVINGLGMGGAEKLLLDLSSYMCKDKKYSVAILVLNNQQEELKHNFEDQGIKIYSVDFRSNYNPMNLYRIIKYMKQYDIVHSHLFPSNYLVSLAKIFLQDQVIITTEHNTHNRRRNYSLLNSVEKFIYSKYNKVISVSNETQSSLLSWLGLMNDKKFVVIENSIDLKTFNRAKPYEKKLFFDDTSFILTKVGSLHEQKDQDTIIKAMKLLPENVKLLLIGKGNKKDKLVQSINKLGLQDRIKFLGIRHDVPSIMKTSDIIIVSSNWEGFGVVAIEGMAAGVPVIASNVDGLKQIVEGFGIVFEKGNERELAKKVTELMGDVNYYNEIAKKCSDRSRDYSIEKLVEQYTRVYDDVLLLH